MPFFAPSCPLPLAGGNGWYEVCDRLGQTANFVTDVARAWQLAEANWTLTTLPEVIGLQCRYALIIASLNSLAANLPVELLIALVQKNVWTPEQGLAHVLQSSNPKMRANLFTELANHLPQNLKELALLKALTATREIQSEERRAYALRALASQLPSVLPEALTAAREIQSEESRAYALGALASQLPSVLPEALTTAREIQSEERRAYALKALASQLPPELLLEALTAAREIQSEESRAKALDALADKLSQMPQSQLFPLWQDSLHWLSLHTRKDLLHNIQVIVPTIFALGGDKAIASVNRAIQDVSRWWS